MKFLVTLDRDEDGMWVAECPSVPGCVSQGQTREEAVANVREAIELFQTDRVAHGVRVMEDPNVVALARERQVPFEVCITSNYQSGVVSSLSMHPLVKMMEAGLFVTINTDDPSISQITLSDEYRLAVDHLGLTQAHLAERLVAAAQVTFLPSNARQALLDRIQTRLRQEHLA